AGVAYGLRTECGADNDSHRNSRRFRSGMRPLASTPAGIGARRKPLHAPRPRATARVHAELAHEFPRSIGSLCVSDSRAGVRRSVRSAAQAQDLLGARSLFALSRDAW